METNETSEKPRLSIETTVAADINLALAQNAVPIIRDLAVVNPKGYPQLEDLTLRIAPDPAFCESVEVTVDRLGEDIRLVVDRVEPKLNLAYLRGLSEAVSGSLSFTLSNKEGKPLVELLQNVRVLARDEWGGTGSLPELIAAFVQPNDAAIGPLLRDVIEALRSVGLRDALDGYASRSPREAAQLVASVWRVVCTLGLGYAVPPASFEKVGQKVRLPLRVHTERIAGCLDLTLLFASLLEQAGFRPLILFKKGHAFAGCWLKPEDFSAPVIDDIQAIRKRRQLGELLVFEVTLAAQATPARFNHACKTADEYLIDEENFICAVDIARARQSGIKPLMFEQGETSAIPGLPVATGADVGLDIPSDIPDEAEEIEAKIPAPPTTPDARVIRWKRKLLDLTLRNPLLNFRAERRAIRMICPDSALLEDMVAAGDKIKIVPLPNFAAGQDPRDLELRRHREQEDLVEQYAREALNRKELVSRHAMEELDDRLTNLFRLAKGALEEGGANVLWLAVGMLSWRSLDEREQRGRSFKAPLVMLPVELVRRSVGSKPMLRVRDEKSCINGTLLQMLRQDFQLTISSFQGELPTDESGLDIRAILAAMRHAIRDLEGWELHDEVVLSAWSFAKFLMYRDLDARTDELKQAPVVRHLIETPNDVFNDGIAIRTLETLDEIEPRDLLVPMETDSSQLAAIAAAAAGKTFVLRGPPGTGKSQTISNIIAHSLGTGKRVLFVAEKTAALAAVYSRLAKIGLGKYCLQLHSNKTSKDKFAEQLNASWTDRGDFNEKSWQDACADLKRHRDSLNRYVRALHRRYRNGWTVYQAIGEVSRFRGAPCVELGKAREAATDATGVAMAVDLGWTNPDIHSEEEYKCLLDVVRRMDVDIVKSGGVHDNPFSAVVKGGWSPSWQSELMSGARKLKPAVERLERTAQAFASAIGLPKTPLSEDRIGALKALPSLLKTVYGKRYGELIGVHGAHVPKLTEANETYARYQDALGYCSVQYHRSILTEELSLWGTDWETSKSTWWPRSFFLESKVRRRLRRHIQGQVKPDPERDLKGLRVAANKARTLDQYSYLEQSIEWLWRGLDTDRERFGEALKWHEEACSVIGRLAADPETWEACRSALVHLTVEQNDRLGEAGPVMIAAQAFQTAATEFEGKRNEAAQVAGGEIAPSSEDLPADIKRIADGWLASEAKLRDWCAWRAVRAQAIQENLSPLVEALEQNVAPGMTAEELFVSGYAKWFLHAAVDRDEVLLQFVSQEHELRISEFSELDGQVRDYTVEYIRLQLRKPVPRQDSASLTTDSAWGQLNRELNRSRGRQKPIRKMLSEVPGPILTLTPCMMMSPISVAQYLDPAAPLFDMVIFDEASQIPTYDAIGALARAKQAVIAGDDKQLPPTSFFDRQDDEDEDISAATPEDLESILDECRAARVPGIGLNWHYRSRDESLIFFSNVRYYDRSLITFPSPNTEGTAVHMRYVKGAVYDKGKSRNNRVEAERVVQHVTTMMRDPDNVERSFGVVTFNAEQQSLIQDLMEAEVRRDRELEKFFGEEQDEPYFTKNLESVQGDERDIIVFSTTYGPDDLGKVSMNFGPLNKPGGQRRLNVAVSRAKHAMYVFSSLRPEDIDLNRTAAEGVRDFKQFLDYALRGPRSLLAGPALSIGGYESPLEAQVAEALRAKGWTVHPQIGVSQFRIDLGVVHPTLPGHYLAGVECDGASYHRSATARDRDLLREQVLKDLGWNISRVWSTDFWVNPNGTIAETDKELREYLQVWQERQEAKTMTCEPGKEPVATQDQPPMEQFAANAITDVTIMSMVDKTNETKIIQPTEVLHPRTHAKTVVEAHHSLATETQGNIPAQVPGTAKSVPGHQISQKRESPTTSTTWTTQVPYRSWAVVALPDPRGAGLDEIVSGLVRIIDTEGPMICYRAYSIYARAAGIHRVGRQIRSVFDNAIRKAVRSRTVLTDNEHRKRDISYHIVRLPDSAPLILRTRGGRLFDEIPPSEIRAMITQLLREQPIQSADDLVKKFAESFEFGHVSLNMRSTILELRYQSEPSVE